MINNVDSTNDGGDEQTYNKTNDSPTQCGVDIELTKYMTHKNATERHCDDIDFIKLVVGCTGTRVGGGVAANRQHIHEYMITMLRYGVSTIYRCTRV